jgi:septal ring factor EnvC (AmiA/AmiB activator)
MEEIREGESRFATADGLVKVEDRLGKVEDRLVKVEDRLVKVEHRLGKVEDRLGKVEDRLVKVEDRLVKVEMDVVRLQGDLRAVEERLGGRIDVLAAELVSMRTGFEARFVALDKRMEEGFAALRRENRLLLLFFSTMLGLLMALFRFGVL